MEVVNRYEFDDNDEDGELADTLATPEELEKENRRLLMMEVRARQERVERMHAENAAAAAQGGALAVAAPPGGGPPAAASPPLPTPLKVKVNFGPGQHDRVLRAMLTELVVPHLGENDINFIYPRKQAVAMNALDYDYDNHEHRVKFENFYHDATMQVPRARARARARVAAGMEVRSRERVWARVRGGGGRG